MNTQKNIAGLFITPRHTIRDAMQVISGAAAARLPVGITLVIDDSGVLIGTVTDGDIRKSLVKGYALDETVETIMARDPITVSSDLGIDEMIEIIKEKVKDSGRIRDTKVDKVIIVDRKKHVVDIVDFYELWHKRECQYQNICIVGTGHVGLTLQIALAEAGLRITGYDVSAPVIASLQKGKVPFYEKGLTPLLKLYLKKKSISFTHRLTSVSADVYIFCVGTPVHAKTKKPVFGNIKKAVASVGKVLRKDDLVIMRSTLPVGTTRKMVIPLLEKVSGMRCGDDFYCVFAPERVAEGIALDELKEIPQIIGGITRKSSEIAARIFQRICASYIVVGNLEEAELVKLVNNSFRDLSFSFANSIAQLGHRLGIDSVRVLKAAREGYPRNPVSLPSPGVGGYCLTKDPYLLSYTAGEYGVPDVLFKAGRKTNDMMPRLVCDTVCSFLNREWKNEKNIKIYILGLAFKGYPETSDVRESPSCAVIDYLRKNIKKKVLLTGYDPCVSLDETERLSIQHCSYEHGFADAHCVLLLNNNREFGRIDIFALLEKMKKPGLFFDGWYFYSPEEIDKIEGIEYAGFCRGSA